MKNIQSLTKTVEKWRLGSAQDRQKPSSRPRRSADRGTRFQDVLMSRWPLKFFDQDVSRESKTKHMAIYSGRRKGRSPFSLLLAVICLTSVIGARFYNQPKLAVGTPAPATILAPSSARFADRKTTEELRKAAQRDRKSVV